MTAKLDPFDATKEHLETYFDRFETFATHYRWDEGEQLFFMKNSLGKTVGIVLWDSGPQMTTEGLMKLLKSQFGTESQAERFKLEMRNRRQMKGESMHDLFIDMKRQVTLAFTDLTGKAVDSVAIEAFANALADEQIRSLYDGQTQDHGRRC